MDSKSGMNQLIALVNKLQNAFAQSGSSLSIDLPQIVVVGGQSAGKSSVLENIVGRDFLPRGNGIVTRRPLILQLINSTQEYAEFLHKPTERYTDMLRVRDEIERETERETGKTKCISAKPINLTIHSPYVLDLTLVDLPGLTQIAIAGQPKDIDQQIRALVSDFITSENSLILAVSPANVDLATSEALRMAREVDPEGRRTFGVVTKLDLMDKGTDARDILNNQTVPLKRGYVGVVNRSQEDINDKKPIEQALVEEQRYFRQHQVYRSMADRMGTNYLQKVLNRELAKHIQLKIPDIRAQLHAQRTDLERRLEEKGDIDNDDWQGKALMRSMQTFVKDMSTQFEGLTTDIETTQLAGGAKINRLFYNEFHSKLSLDDMPANTMRQEIAYTIRNIYGVRNALFTPDMAFHATVGKIVEQYKDPVRDCVDLVSSVMREVLHCCLSKLSPYPQLLDTIEMMVEDQIRKQDVSTKKHLMLHIDAENAFYNTRHEDFTQAIGSGVSELEQVVRGSQPKQTWAMVQRERRWLLLRESILEIHYSAESVEPIERINLRRNVCMVDDPRPEVTSMVLYKDDGSDLCNSYKEATIGFESTDQHRLWLEAFKAVGVAKELHSGRRDAAMKTSSSQHKGLSAKLGFNNNKDKEKDKVTSSSWYSEQSNSVPPEPAARGVKPFREAPPPPPRKGRSASPAPLDEALGSDWVYVQRRQKYQQDISYRANIDQDSVGTDRQVEDIKVMVEAYLRIVSKTLRDLVPKYIMLLLVNNVRDFVKLELQSHLMKQNATELMKESAEETETRENLRAALKTCREALSIISQTSLIGLQ